MNPQDIQEYHNTKKWLSEQGKKSTQILIYMCVLLVAGVAMSIYDFLMERYASLALDIVMVVTAIVIFVFVWRRKKALNKANKMVINIARGIKQITESN